MKNQETITVLIADDHDFYRDGLKLQLNRDKALKMVGEARNGKELVLLTKKLLPKIVITDLIMPELSGVDAIKQLRAANVPSKYIVISTFDSDRLIVEALEAGALGYVLKNAGRGEIVEAVKTVYQNQPYYCRYTSSKLAIRISRSKFNPYARHQIMLFNELEKHVIRLICEEKTSEEIGKLLFMSKRTVDGFRKRLLEKTKSKGTAGLVTYAIKHGLYVI